MKKEGCRRKKMKVKDVELKMHDEKWNIEWRIKVIKGEWEMGKDEEWEM